MPTASSTFIYIGNLADIDPNEANYSNENPNALFQTFGRADMSVTTVVQNDVNGDGTVQENDNGQTPDTFSYDVGNGPVTSGLDNAARYAVDYIDQNGNTQSTTVSGYQTENGDVFLKFPNGIQMSSVTVKSMVGDGYSGITHGTSSNAQVVCFARGTLIDTPAGQRAVETLKIGDQVQTRDHGPQTIRWLQSSTHALDATTQGSRPILVRQDTFGAGRPLRDLIVSPLHRIIVGGGGQLEHWFQAEAFAPAKALTDLKGVRSMRGKKTITWVHFACDRHEVISANGCLSETLLLGPMVLHSLSPTKRRVLQDMYGAAGEGDNPMNGPPARACLKNVYVRTRIKQGLAQDAQTSKNNIRLWDDDLALEYASSGTRSVA